ncbi:MAG TPA: mobile mystery protein B [Planctomycetaceae bacterium]|jgi:Fic-DOC domain mobile mystery protein B|nr:mobile mystery protein B [Planctomycetaceae bacterium]
MSQWDPISGETPIDISGLKIKGITNRRELNDLEAENVRKAIIKYLGRQLNNRIAPFTYEWLLRLHKEMFGDVWQWAGLQRTSKLNLGCAPHLIPEQLGHLLGNLKSWTDEFKIPFAEQAAMLHHQAVAIHPFENGNGRWSRLLANIWLRRAGQPYVAWPDSSVGQESTIRNDYLAALKAADQGSYAELMALQARYLAHP